MSHLSSRSTLRRSKTLQANNEFDGKFRDTLQAISALRLFDDIKQNERDEDLFRAIVNTIIPHLEETNSPFLPAANYALDNMLATKRRALKQAADVLLCDVFSWELTPLEIRVMQETRQPVLDYETAVESRLLTLVLAMFVQGYRYRDANQKLYAQKKEAGT